MKKKINEKSYERGSGHSDGGAKKERSEQADCDGVAIRDAQFHSEKASLHIGRTREAAAHCNEPHDSAASQSRDLESTRLEARRRVQERIDAERNSRSSRPLQGLVLAEVAIEARAEAAVILSNQSPSKWTSL